MCVGYAGHVIQFQIVKLDGGAVAVCRPKVGDLIGIRDFEGYYNRFALRIVRFVGPDFGNSLAKPRRDRPRKQNKHPND